MATNSGVEIQKDIFEKVMQKMKIFKPLNKPFANIKSCLATIICYPTDDNYIG
jgi:hypothetical protein